MNIDIVVKVLIPLLGAILTYLIIPFILQKKPLSSKGKIFISG